MHKQFTVGSWVSLEHLPRRLSVVPPVVAIGDLRKKRFWEKRPAFYVCSFCFILRGAGEYRNRGKRWRVAAPCVLAQFPGQAFEYGPDEHWDEIFIAYAGEQINFFRDGGIDLAERPVWEINRIAAVQHDLHELLSMVAGGHMEQEVDSIDAMCLKIVTDSLLDPIVEMSLEETAIRRIRAKIDEDLFTSHTTRSLARLANMSTSTFRRHWLRYVGAPPQQYIIGRKIEMACQLLQTSELRVGEIARGLHFDNELYFSRLFKKKTGRSPSDFRAHELSKRLPDEAGV